MSTNELDKSIEELEAEVIAELEEANSELDEAKMKQPNDSGAAAQKADTVDGERQDMGPAVVKPDAKSDPGKAASSKAKEISGDAQQKGEKPAEKPKKLAAGDQIDHDGEELDEKSKKEEFPKDMIKKGKEKDGDEEEDEDEDQEAVENAKKEAVELRIKEIDVSEDVSALVSGDDSCPKNLKRKQPRSLKLL